MAEQHTAFGDDGQVHYFGKEPDYWTSPFSSPILAGEGSPDGVIQAKAGTIYMQTNGSVPIWWAKIGADPYNPNGWFIANIGDVDTDSWGEVVDNGDGTFQFVPPLGTPIVTWVGTDTETFKPDANGVVPLPDASTPPVAAPADAAALYVEGGTFKIFDNLTPDPLVVGAIRTDTSLPAASAALRGQLRVIKGAATVADQVYACYKLADDTYGWQQIAGPGTDGVYHVDDFGAKGDNATDNTAAIDACITAAETAGDFNIVQFGVGTYKTAGNAYTNVIPRGLGSSITRIKGTSGHSTLVDLAFSTPYGNQTQTGHTNGWTFAMTGGGFMIEGDGTAGATKHGMKLSNCTNLTLNDVQVFATGGKCLWLDGPTGQCHANTFNHFVLNQPVSASANDVPFVHVQGVCNGNTFSDMVLRTPTSGAGSGDIGVSGAFLIERDNTSGTVNPNQNTVERLKVENLNIPAGVGSFVGVVVIDGGGSNVLRDIFTWDLNNSGGRSNNCIVLLKDSNALTYDDGNSVVGQLPSSTTAGVEYGIQVETNGNYIWGHPGTNGRTVHIASGAVKNAVGVLGRAETTGGGFQNPVVDDAAANTNLIFNHPNQEFTFGGFADTQLTLITNSPVTIADPTGGATIDAEARTAINALIDALEDRNILR